MPVRRKHQHALLSSTILIPASAASLGASRWRGDGGRWRIKLCVFCGEPMNTNGPVQIVITPGACPDQPCASRSPVSASSPRGRPVSLGGLDPVVPDSEPEIAASEAISEEAAAYAECPKCGSGHYAQQTVRS